MTTTIKIKRGKKGTPPLEFTYNFGANAQEMMTIITPAVVYAAALSTCKQQLGDYVRRRLAQKKNPPSVETIQAELDDNKWKPGERRRGKSAVDKASKLIASMTDEQKKALFDAAGYEPRLGRQDATVAKFAPMPPLKGEKRDAD